jgi:hydroxymethylglutaryl-CoA reductase
MQDKVVKGFSKLDKEQKLDWILTHFFDQSKEAEQDFKGFWHSNEALQTVLDGFSENTVSNFPMPFGIAPNFLINGKLYAVPMVIEESSVVAAASSAAKFWLTRGGFRAEVLSTKKLGQVHFFWKGKAEKLVSVFEELKNTMNQEAAHITANMEKRGGGVLEIKLLDFTDKEAEYYQLLVSFETCDSMGANFINSVLESYGQTLERFVAEHEGFTKEERELEVLMAILSNYTPECLVRASVSCPVEQLGFICDGIDPKSFADRFYKAVRVAQIDPYRATTHNKGIMNGVDSVVLATANDFRAIESSCHAYAAHDGQYRSLSSCSIEDGIFKFWVDLPLALGTVGGLTKLHPLAKRSLELLGHPSATELMEIVAATGLAQNFAAVRSLITTGIQQGHMKMHLKNILIHLKATEEEITKTYQFFEDKVVSFSGVREFVEDLRKKKVEGRVKIEGRRAIL